MVTLKKCKKVSKNLTLFTFRAQMTTIQRILSTSTSRQATKPLILIDADAICLYCIPFISRKDAKPLSFLNWLLARGSQSMRMPQKQQGCNCCQTGCYGCLKTPQMLMPQRPCIVHCGIYFHLKRAICKTIVGYWPVRYRSGLSHRRSTWSHPD